MVMCPEMILLSYIMSDSPSHKFRWAQQQSVLRQKGTLGLSPSKTIGQSSLHIAQTLMSLTTVAPLLLPCLVLRASWRSPYNQLKDVGKVQGWLINVLAQK